MKEFYNKYKNFQPLAGNLSWSHYCYLIYIEDDHERSFYEKECINSKWSKRELKRQIDSSLFQRLLLSNGKTNIKLPENLKEIAKLRLDNPDVSLIELGKMLQEPVGKSGVNYRLKRLIEIANELEK